MIFKLYKFIYFITLILAYSLSLLYFDFAVFSLLFTLLGILLRIFIKKYYLIVFSFMIPILSVFAGFNRSGFPNNYLILPIFVLMGVVIADSIINKEFLSAGKNMIPRHYVYYLLIALLSFVFIIFRWSNLLISKMAFLKNTPVDISGERVSFAILFSVLELALFVLSVPYYVFCQSSLNRNKLVIAFLSGQSISVLFALGQYIFNKPITTVFNMATGLASDPTAFGMLCAISFVMTWYLIKKESYKISYFFIIIFLSGIFISVTRVAYIAFLTIPFIGFRKIKKRFVWISSILVLIVTAFAIAGIVKTDKENSVNEVKQTLRLILNLANGSSEKNATIYSIMSRRTIIWDFALTAIKQFPLTGIGPGNFIFWGRSLIGKHYLLNATLTANSYLLITVANGLIGAGLFVLFIITILKKKQWPEKILILILLLMCIFNDSLWLSEIFLGFWLICSLGEETKVQKAGKKEGLIVLLLVLLFIIMSTLKIPALMPHDMLKKGGVRYDYGFWYHEIDQSSIQFNWSKSESGLYIYLNKQGKSEVIKITCSAPLSRLPGKRQAVDVYWRGELYRQIVFRENGEYSMQVEDANHSEGFLEFRVHPTFNLKKMGLGAESRDLGVRVSIPGI